MKRRLDQGDRDDESDEVDGNSRESRSPPEKVAQPVRSSDAGVENSHRQLLCITGAIRKHLVCTLLPVRRPRTRWEEDNVPPVNVAAIATFVLLTLGLAAIIVLALT